MVIFHHQPTGWLETNPNEFFAMENNHHQQTSLFFCGLSKIDQDMDISYIHVYMIYIIMLWTYILRNIEK